MAQKKENIKGKSTQHKGSTQNKNTKSGTYTKKSNTTTKVTPKEVKREKIDSKTMGILIALYVLVLVVSFLTMGLVTTLIMGAGIGLICYLSHLMKDVKIGPKKRKVFNIIAIIILSICIFAAIAVGGLFTYVVITAPEFNPDNLKYKESSIIYDKDDNEIDKIGVELRENIDYKDLPQVFVNALIATEDSRFFYHNGFDAPRFLVATVKQLLRRPGAGGASTLSMQVVKNSYTSSEDSGIKGILRKFTDIYLSVFKLEKEYSKENIIQYYVNNHPLGGIVFGVEEAAQTYFGKSIKDVNLAEAAVLAGMFKAPSDYNPNWHPDKAEERRGQVLSLMVRHGYITQEEADAANSIPVESLLASSNKASSSNSEYQGYIDLVLDELNSKYGISYTQTPVLIYTNMDREKQKGITNIFNSVKDSYNNVNYKNTSVNPWITDNIQGGVAVVENATGKLIAIGAGRNRQGERTLSFATRQRQIGSTAKPIFAYGPGIEYENWSSYQQFVDEPWNYTNGPSINNSDLQFMGQISLRTALAQSRNVPAVKAIQSLNKNNVREFATNLGIPIGDEGLHEAHALGAYNPGASPIEMAGAYAAFANGGYYTEPYTIRKIVIRDTGEEIEANPEREQVMSDSTAFIITDCLKTAVNNGISSGAKISGVNVAAKTGTSSFDDNTKKKRKLPDNAVNDAWIVGYDPEYTIGMWYGYASLDDGYQTNIQAVNGRTRLFRLLGNVVFTKNGQDFKAPSSVVHQAVEVGSNPALLPSENTPDDQITYEYFKAGTEPTQVSTKYQKLEPVTNLSGTYDSEEKKVVLKWTGVTKKPSGNDSYGEFGYNVYFGNTLLGFTTETTYSFKTESPNGVYTVRSAFKNFKDNESEKVSVTIKEDGPTSVYRASLNGKQFEQLSIGDTYQEPSPPILVIDTETKKDVTEEVMASGLTTTIKDENGEVVTKIDTASAHTYTITYTIEYETLNVTLTRTISVQ